MSINNLQMDGSGRRVVGPADQRQPKQPERMVTLYNIGYEAGTLLEINHSVIRMPEKGKAFQVPERNARLFLRLYSRRAGNQIGVARRPDGSLATAAPKAPPGFRLVSNEEYDRMTGKNTAEQKAPAIVPERVRILENEKKAAIAVQAAKLAAAQAPAAVEEDEFELDLVAGDIPDEIIEVHNSIKGEMELEGILDGLDDIE